MMEFSQYGKRILILNYPLTISLVQLFSKCYVQKKYFYKKQTKNLADITKTRTFAPVFKEGILKIHPIGVWCNGNTADSGPAFPGSSPGTPTKTTFQCYKIPI